MKAPILFVLAIFTASPIAAQSGAGPLWSWESRLEIRGALRESEEEEFPLQFPFRDDQLPPGEVQAFARTVDPGRQLELNLVSLRLDLFYGDVFQARVKIDGIDLYDRNPTSGDRQVDGDEVWLRFGRKPEGLNLPNGTSWFVQAGKWPKIEKQPELLLESYGLSSTSFSRFEDLGLLAGGSVGRHLYWRAQITNGNPLFFRDSNALAGDNGTDELLQPNPVTKYGSGFPILYDAEVEGWTFDLDEPEIGAGIGWRWSNDAGSGVDALLFHYQRKLQPTVDLHGTFYGGDLDLFSAGPFSIATEGTEKRESGARIWGRWKGLTWIAHGVDQDIAGLGRRAFELETGYQIPLGLGLREDGSAWIERVQPAIRISTLDNDFRGPPQFPAPSIWWDWDKLDLGLRVDLLRDWQVTLEHSIHDVKIARELDIDETLVTLRYRRTWTGGF